MSDTVNVRLFEIDAAMRKLPDPNTYAGDFYRKAIPERASYAFDGKDVTLVTMRTITFRKERFGEGRKSWLEWTLDLKP